jgi:predicted glutamine amidotransferase
MSRLFGLVINDAQRVACALYPARDALLVSSAPEGWGLACYQGGEVLLQRHPKPVIGPLDLYRHTRDQRTDYLVGQVRDATTPAKLENTQPYRFRSWVFARSGGKQAGAAGVLEQVPDFLRRNIRGQDPAEALFYLFLAYLHEKNRLDDPGLRAPDATAALAATIAIADKTAKAAGGEAAPANMIVTNGRLMLAARSGPPLYTRAVNGIVDCAVCAEASPDEAKRDRRRTSHEHVRALLLVSEPEKLPEAGFEEVADGTIVAVDRELTRTTAPVRP